MQRFFQTFSKPLPWFGVRPVLLWTRLLYVLTSLSRLSIYLKFILEVMCLYIRFCSVPCTLSTWGAWDVVYGVVCFVSCSLQNCLMLRLKNSLPLSLQLKNYKIVFFQKTNFLRLNILKVFKFSRLKFQFRFVLFLFS